MSALPIIFPTSGDNSTGDLSYVHSRDLNQAQLSLQKISLYCFIQCWNRRSHGQIKSHWLCGSQLRFASLVRQVCEAARGLTLLLTMQENCSKTAFNQLSICLSLQTNELRSLRMKPSWRWHLKLSTFNLSCFLTPFDVSDRRPDSKVKNPDSF